ncbi:MAG: hypothetical protein ROO76_06750 [Terriglobia bacterium]|nr:hypothetical protein [Terriglobia bacterium]
MAQKKSNTPGRPQQPRGEWKVIGIAVVLLLSCVAVAQQSEPEGKVSGNYVVTQSVEFGVRFADNNGSDGTYESMVGLHTGPRLLDQTLSMRSINHIGSVFDSLWMSSFGYGGDPERATRLRMYKNHWYDFAASYRYDINSFDYNLLANPLVPANVYAPNSISPHFMNTRRNFGDFNLTIAPQSPMRLRLGYSRNNNEGPAATSYHEGTEIMLNENFRNRSDRYQLGVDWKFARKTQLSYDFFFDHNKVDTVAFDGSVGNFTSNGVPADLGIIYDPFNSQPCANTPTPIVNSSGAIKPNCGLYLYYSRSAPTRTDFPTSQLSLVSNYWNKLDITASGSYSSGRSKMDNFDELARTYVSRTNETGFQVSGPAVIDRISTNADLGLTYHLNDQWSVTNQLRYLYWRIPAMWNSSEIACYANVIPSGAAPANVFSPSGPTTAGATACLPDAFTGQLAIPITSTPSVLTTSSGGNVTDENFIYYYGQRTVSNTTLLEVDANRLFSAHIGFRYGNRRYNDKDNSYSTTIYYPYNLWTGSTLVAQPGGTVTTEPAGDAGEVLIHEKTLLAGVILRPVDAWRVNADFEFVNNDEAFTRIAPTTLFVFRGRSSYRVSKDVNVSGSMSLRQGSNDVSPAGFISAPEQDHRDHAYSYNGNVNYTPNDRFALDLGYTFNDIYSNTGSCLPVSTRPSVIPAEGGALSYCYDPTAATPTPTTGDYAVVVRYKERINTGYFNLMFKPVKRVALSVGYDISSNSGSDGFLRADTLAPLLLQQSRVQAGGSTTAFVPYNPNVPQGPLAISFHKPSAGASIEVAKGVFLKGDYAYYGYNEKSDPTGASALVGGSWVGVAPRDFHATVGTVGVKYQF